MSLVVDQPCLSIYSGPVRLCFKVDGGKSCCTGDLQIDVEYYKQAVWISTTSPCAWCSINTSADDRIAVIVRKVPSRSLICPPIMRRSLMEVRNAVAVTGIPSHTSNHVGFCQLIGRSLLLVPISRREQTRCNTVCPRILTLLLRE